MKNSPLLADRAPPHSERAERVLLAGLFREPDLVTRACIRHGVGESDLYFHAHRLVWRTVWDLVEAGVIPDLAGVYQVLICREQDRELNGDRSALWLAELYDADPTGAWCDWACEVVLWCSSRRAVIHRATESLRDAYDGVRATGEYERQLT